MEVKHYDVIVIGAGAGNKISVPASKLGRKVAVVEEGYDVLEDGQLVHKHGLGGTCLTRGCIPSKMLIHAADVATTVVEAPQYQVVTSGFETEFRQLVERVSATVDADSDEVHERWGSNPNLDYYPVRARFTAPRTLAVGDRLISADRIYIATGSRPLIPDIPGLADTPFLTSKDALRLRQKPRSLTVLGGGYIGCELGHYFGGLGVEVHVLARSGLLSYEDEEVAAEFTRVFSRRYDTHVHATVLRVAHDGAQFHVTFTAGDSAAERTLQTDQLLVATGVVPNSDMLDLAKTNITVNAKGFIEVDDCLRTGCPGVWAFGDVIGRFLFRHSANKEAEYLYERLVHPDRECNLPMDYTGMPHAVFSSPQVAGVGMMERDVTAAGLQYVKGVNSYASSAMGMALRSDSGFVKILIERGSRRILGCHIVGHEASVLVHTVIPLMRLNGRLDDLLLMTYIHPALPEILRNACRKARDALIAAGEDLPMALVLA